MGRINLFENLFEMDGAATAQQFPPLGDLDTLRERMGGRRDGKLVISKRYASAAKRFAGFAYRRIFPVQKVLDWLERNPDFTLTWERFELARLEQCEQRGQKESKPRMKKPTIERETVAEAVYAALGGPGGCQ